MRKKLWMAVASLVFLGVTPTGAQESALKVTPLRIQVVLARYDGEKKLSSMPYTLWVNATLRDRESPVSLRMGVQVPVVSRGKDNVPEVTYRNVGTNIDSWASLAPDSRFAVQLSVEQTSIYGDDREKRQPGAAATGALQTSFSGQPVFRSFSSSFKVMLKDGETTQYVAATDPVNGEVLKIDVTLSIIK